MCRAAGLAALRASAMPLAMRITAPGRTVEIKGMIKTGNSKRCIGWKAPPDGSSSTSSNPDALELDAGGGFLIAVSVSETEQDRQLKSQPDPSR